jgi:hypothetical protein
MTLAPNTVNKVWIIKNSTSGSQSINISQGSGSNVTIANGATVMVYTDGAGSGAAVSQVDLIGGGGTITGNLNFEDNVKAQFGDSQDLQIYHDGSNSYVDDAGTGNLQIRASSQIKLQKYTGENMFVGIADGAASIYYDNSQKLATTSSGVTVTGTVTSDGLSLGDNEYAYFGADNDLQIYHDGGGSWVEDAGAGYLKLASNGSGILLQKGTTETMAQFLTDGAVTLFHDNAEKLATTSYGIDISGSVVADTNTSVGVGATPTPDMANYQNFIWTLNTNANLGNPSTEKVGQTGFFVFIQDGTGGHTLGLGSEYKTAGGAGITLSTAASAVDVVPYIVQATGTILLGTPQLAFS